MKLLRHFGVEKCMPILTTEGMRGLDNDTKSFYARGNGFGNYAHDVSPVESGYALMKEAGQALFDHVRNMLPEDCYGVSVAIFVGGGNNGGDGLVLAKLMLEAGIHCVVYSVAKAETFKNEAAFAYADFKNAGGKLISTAGGLPQNPNFALVVDCLLGNGASGELRPAFAQIVSTINSWGIPVLAADAPTGYDSSQHNIGSVCINATETMLFGMPRLDAYCKQTSSVFGKVTVAPLSFPADLIYRYNQNLYLINEDVIPALLPERSESGEKRDQGTALIIAGSGNMTGAAALCTEAALRSGAGLVTLATPKAILPVLQSKLSEPVFCGLGTNDCEALSIVHLPQLQIAASHAKAVAIGPGLGTDTITQDAIRMFLTGLNVPVVVDADAINACGSAFFCMEGGPANAIITPHKREWERNFGPLPTNEFYYPEYLRQFATQFNITILLKGSPTYIALPDGRVYIVPAKNSGMAKGGSGDVLTGIIVSLLAQGLPTGEATVLGALLHQKAGRLTRKDLGAYSMQPSDVIDHLHLAFG
ncbi:MAG: NAD(P)H-hydrate dehydratase [Fibrobacter sp.]|nr:NAD(P)H-hydrate dehydratase [Fibrobacter sp.]